MPDFHDHKSALEELLALAGEQTITAVVVAPTHALTNLMFEEFMSRFSAQVKRSGGDMRVILPNRSTISFRSLSRARNFEGPQFSHVLKVVTPELAEIFESLDRLAHALRIEPRAERFAVYK